MQSDKFKIKIGEHVEELKEIIGIEKTLATASGKKDISPYVEKLGELYKQGKLSGEELAQEWIAECCSKYVIGECSKTTREFFDGLFSGWKP